MASAKNIVREGHHKDHDRTNRSKKCSEVVNDRPVSKTEMLLSFINSIGAEVEDLQERAEREEMKAAGAFSALADIELLLASPEEDKKTVLKKIREMRVELAEKHNRNLGKYEAFKQVVMYLDQRRGRLVEQASSEFQERKRQSGKQE